MPLYATKESDDADTHRPSAHVAGQIILRHIRLSREEIELRVLRLQSVLIE